MQTPRFFILGAVSSLIFLCSHLSAKSQTWSLEVPAIVPWYDTGIDVMAGQQIGISTSGSVRWATGSPGINANGVGEGWDGTLRHPGTVVPSAIWLSFIGKVGGDIQIGNGTPLPEGGQDKGLGFVGSEYSQVMTTSGRLFLGFNDTTSNFGDNGGAFSVTVAVVPEPTSVLLLVAALSLAFCFWRRKDPTRAG